MRANRVERLGTRSNLKSLTAGRGVAALLVAVHHSTTISGGVYAGQNDVFVSKLARLIPMGRMARVDEYRGAVVFLCSDASSYLNGANLVMDGGRSVW